MKRLLKNRQQFLTATILLISALFLVTACGGGSRPEPIRSIPTFNQSQQYQMQQLQQNPYQNFPYTTQQAPMQAAPVVPMQQMPANNRMVPMTAPVPTDNDELYYPRYFFD